MGQINLLRQTVASMLTPAAGKTGLATDSTSKQLVLKDDSGNTVLIPGVPGQNPPGGIASLTSAPGTFGAVETVVNTGSIPANSLVIGTTLHIITYGTISAASAGTVLGRIRLGINGTTADTQVCATTAIGAATAAIGFVFEGFVTIITTGAGGTAIGNASMTVSGVSTNVTAQTATITVNTTVANFIEPTLIGGGTTPVVTIARPSVIEVVKS